MRRDGGREEQRTFHGFCLFLPSSSSDNSSDFELPVLGWLGMFNI
jgi:hypothetical protein